MKILLLVISVVLFTACGKPDANNLEEKTQRELQVENGNLERKAQTLESDLRRKQNFFIALEGTFEGNLPVGDKEFKTRITLIPSLPIYNSNRVRTLEEITADLNNLFFTVQATHWNSKGSAVASGCIFSQARPDFLNGQTIATGENCANVYRISMYESNPKEDALLDEVSIESLNNFPEILAHSQNLSIKVLNKELNRIDQIHVVIQPTLVAKTFTTVLKRVNP